MQAPRASTSTPSWPPPSPVTVFLRNAHLLQLDQQQDWPGLSRKLFSGGQKLQTQRVKSVEWVLYHLFLLWNPSEAKNKLRPFFPPLEPLQSVNLRAALFRALSDLKRYGDLGRETIVRKTMLDDCKGPKFEEVLAVFSTAVLRKVVLSENSYEPALRLASARSLSDTDVEEKLIPLILAHHTALSKTRRDNVRIRESYEQFVNVLDEQEKELAARSKRKKQQSPEELPYAASLVHKVKANWLGSQQLLDALFNGGSPVEKDAFLELPFEQAWYHAKKVDIDQLIRRPSHVDLLQNMEMFSSKQRGRLQRLKAMKKSMAQVEEDQGSRAKAETNSRNKDRGLSFRDHQTLTVAATSKSLRGIVEQPRNLFDEHQAIISSLRTTLAEAKGVQLQQLAHSSLSPTTVVEPPEDQPLKNEPTLSPIPDAEQYLPSPSPSPSVQVTDYEDEYHAPIPQRPSDLDNHSTIPIKDLDDPSPLDTDKQETELTEREFSHPRIESRPSTLLERTRQSMSFLPPPSSSSQEPELPSIPEPELSQSRLEPRQSSLWERTRQSMSLLPPSSSTRPRQSLAARRETRQSQYFPINQFDTPAKEVVTPDPVARSGASTPRDDLFSEEAEYASIFKSRPRVAHSPLMSPAVHVGFDDHDHDDAEGGYVEDGESVLDLAVAGSPLAMKKR